MRHRALALQIAALATCVAACDLGTQPSTASPRDAQPSPDAAATPAPGEAERPSDRSASSTEVTDANVFVDETGAVEIPAEVIAKVGDVEITTQQFRAIYDLHANKWSARSRNMIPQQDALDRKNIANRLIYQECLRQEAAALKVRYDDKELRIRQARARRGVGDWKEHLRWRGESDDSTRAMIVAELLEEAILNKRGELRVTKAEVKKEYNRVKGSWTSDQPRVRASHILVPVGLLETGAGRTMSPEEVARWKSKAKAEANEIYRKARGSGADFAALAREYGAGGTAAKGGNLGFFTKARMAAEFIEEIFTLPVGNISPPIRTDEGYHIIKVTGRYDAGALPLAAVSETLEQRLRDKKLERGRARLKQELPTRHTVVNYLEPN